MTDTTTSTDSPARRQGSLSSLRLPQLQALASELGVKGTSRMRKSDLLDAIRSRQSGGAASGTTPPATSPEVSMPTQSSPQSTNGAPPDANSRPDRGQRAKQVAAGDQDAGSAREADSAGQDARADDVSTSSRSGDSTSSDSDNGGRGGRERPAGHRDRNEDRQQSRQRDRQHDRQQQDGSRGDRQQQDGDTRDRGDDRQGGQQGRSQQGGQQNRSSARDDDEEGGGRRRRNRYRDRKRRGRGNDPMGGQGNDEPEVSEDDVLLPVAGILDVLDNYGFVRTSGYLPGTNDVYVSLGQVRKYGMRKGDAIVGAVRQPREGDQGNQRQKFNALVRLDSVNGMTPEEAKARPDFMKLTPLYPQERLRLETEPGVLTTRVLDLVAPIGKGQRALIVSPPKAGKTMMMQAIANAISANNPEVYLMVVLVDERPEEVTDFQRSVKGEVIASTFDRPASDHTTVAELAIERAKRLVEMGNDVVVLLDGITRLGRAYNISAPASGRILSGGVDSSALYPPKKFFGAARNIENGGSLTILATALVETGSKADEVIFEEFKGTGNSEFRLSRSLADKRVYPAVDVNASGTRREEILLGKDELAVMWKLRRVLTALDSQQAIELLLSKLRDTRSNTEFLMQVQKTTTPLMSAGDD